MAARRCRSGRPGSTRRKRGLYAAAIQREHGRFMPSRRTTAIKAREGGTATPPRPRYHVVSDILAQLDSRRIKMTRTILIAPLLGCGRFDGSFGGQRPARPAPASPAVSASHRLAEAPRQGVARSTTIAASLSVASWRQGRAKGAARGGRKGQGERERRARKGTCSAGGRANGRRRRSGPRVPRRRLPHWTRLPSQLRLPGRRA